MQKMELILDETDVKELLTYAHEELCLQVYSHRGTPFDLCVDFSLPQDVNICLFPAAEHPIVEGEGVAKHISSNSVCIWFSKSYSTKDRLFLPGMIWCSNMLPELAPYFKHLVKHIKNNYTLAHDKVYYIGPSMYAAWKKHREPLQFFVDAKSIEVDGTKFNISEFCCKVERLGYHIEARNQQGHAITDTSFLQMKSFIICPGVTVLKVNYARGVRWILPDSGCIFLYHRKTLKRDRWVFIADERHFANDSDSNEIQTLFYLIDNMFNT